MPSLAFPSHLSLSPQQMDEEVRTVGTQRWVIVIAEPQAEGHAPVMKCYDGDGLTLAHYGGAEAEWLLKNTHFSGPPHLLLAASLSHLHALTCGHTLLAVLKNHSRSHTQGHTHTGCLGIQQMVEEVHIPAWPWGS